MRRHLTDVSWSVVFMLWVLGMAASSGIAATNYITMQGTRFVPDDITISPGDTVIWLGNSSIHTVTGIGSDPFCGNKWITGSVRCEKTFPAAGTFNYRCGIHGVYGMKGVVRVAATNAFPTTTLTQPAAGSVFATDQSFTMRATAQDTNGSVVKVEFLAGETILGSVTNTPYTLLVSNFLAGNYTLRSRATDNQGATGSSAPVTISVVTPGPSTLTSSGLVGGSFQVTFTATTGLSYILQASTNLVDWVSQATNRAEAATITFTDTTAPGSSTRFYRSVRVK